MTSIFQQARQTTDEDIEESQPVFQFLKEHKKQNIIPPVGIADPELVDSFLKNMEDEEKILKTIQEVEAYNRETPVDTAKREVLSHAARAGEGFLGGISSFFNMMNPGQTFENEEGIPEYFPGIKLPESQELREITKGKTGKYLEPKNEYTKISQEIGSDIGSMFSTPGLGWMQKLLLPIGGQSVKQLIKASGGSEKSQDIGKLGFMALSTIAGNGNAQRVAGNAMNQAQQMIPRGVRFSSRPTEQALQRIRNSDWFRSGSTPSKASAIAEIERIEQQIQNGSIDAHMAMQLREDVNEARRQLGGFQLNRPVNRRQALAHLDEVDRALLDSMENYGNRVNPNWWNQYQRANEAYRITQRSRLISDFIEQHARPLKSDIAKTLFHVGGASAIVNAPLIASAAIPGLAGAKGIQIINRMIRSPVLRNHYIEVMTQAAAGNAAATKKALDKFDAVASKLEEKKY